MLFRKSALQGTNNTPGLQTLGRLKNALAPGLIALLLAGFAWAFAGHVGGWLFPTAHIAAPNPLAADSNEVAARIASKHLFGIATAREELRPSVAQANPAQLQLIGVIDGGKHGLAVMRIDTGKPLQLAPGDTFGNGYRLLAVHSDSAEIESTSGRFEIQLIKPAASP